MRKLTRRLSFRKVSEILGIDLDDVRALVVEERRIPAIYVTQIGHSEPYEYQMIKVDAEGRVCDMVAGGLNSDIHTGFLRIERVELDKFMLDEGLSELDASYKAELVEIGAVESAVLAQPQEAQQVAPTPAPANENTQQRNARWLLQFDDAKLKRSSVSQRSIAKEIGEREGENPETVKKGLQAAEKLRKEQYRSGGLQITRPKKHSAADPFNQTSGRAR